MNRKWKAQLLILLMMATILLPLMGCRAKTLDNASYTVAYDEIMDMLEATLEEYVFMEMRDFYVLSGFNSTYNHRNQMTYMEVLVDTLDEVLYQLDQLGPSAEDPVIRAYQSEIEYALKEIRSRTNNLLKVEDLDTMIPGKSILYREVYRYMTGMNDDMLRLIQNEIGLDQYLDTYRTDRELADKRALLKEKNRLRYLYTYTAITSYLAPTDDYSGLHVSPNNPWVLIHKKTYMVYELSFALLYDFRDFYLAYMAIVDSETMVTKSEAFDYFFEQFNRTVEAYETYYQVRSTYPLDFYTGEIFKSYEVDSGNRRVGYFQDFDDQYTDLIAMKEAYITIREILADEKLWQLMYE